MSRFDSPLYQIKIASPCSADWQGMFGNERRRFCGECKLNVYNLSGMTLKEAEALLEQSEGRLCVRYFRRADGTILTQDCPVGWAKVKQRASRVAAAAFSLIVGLFSGLFAMSIFSNVGRPGSKLPIEQIGKPDNVPLMGAVAISNSDVSSQGVPNYELGVMGNVAVPIKRSNVSRPSQN